MRSTSFSVLDAQTVEDAIDTLNHFGSRAALLAGGQDLISELNARRSNVDVLVNLKTVGALHGIHRQGGWVEIGAMTRMREIEDLAYNTHGNSLGIPRTLASVASAAGPKAVRTLGTLGGNLASIRAGTLWPAAVSSLGGRLRLVNGSGARNFSLSDGIRALRETGSPSLITSIVVKDEAQRLVIGRARLPLAPYPLPAVCAIAVAHASQQTARITIVGPGAVPYFQELPTGALDDISVCTELAAKALPSITSAEIRRTSEIVLHALIRRLASRAVGDDQARTFKTVVIDAG